MPKEPRRVPTVLGRVQNGLVSRPRGSFCFCRFASTALKNIVGKTVFRLLLRAARRASRARSFCQQLSCRFATNRLRVLLVVTALRLVLQAARHASRPRRSLQEPVSLRSKPTQVKLKTNVSLPFTIPLSDSIRRNQKPAGPRRGRRPASGPLAGNAAS